MGPGAPRGWKYRLKPYPIVLEKYPTLYFRVVQVWSRGSPPSQASSPAAWTGRFIESLPFPCGLAQQTYAGEIWRGQLLPVCGLHTTLTWVPLGFVPVPGKSYGHGMGGSVVGHLRSAPRRREPEILNYGGR